MFFRLNPECYFIEGDCCGAIYDLVEGSFYALGHQEAALIQKCENNQPVSGNEEFLRELKRECIGNFYDKKIYVEKLRLGSPVVDLQPGYPPEIVRAFLEINNTCDRSCWYCGYHAISRSQGCLGCNKWDETGEDLSIDRWKQVIDELRDLGCAALFFTGGDLTLAWEKTRELLEYSHDKFLRVFIILNSRNFSQEIACEVNNYAVPIIQVSNPSEVRPDNTQQLLIIEHDPDVEKGYTPGKNLMIDIVSKNFKKTHAGSLLTSKKKLPEIDIHTFFHNKKGHPCLGNSLAVSWKGDIIPCTFLRSHPIGNIRDTSLSTVIGENWDSLKTFWNLRLDTVGKCKKCEFRYSCSDCRALEEAQGGDLNGKQFCDYHPETGTWQ